MRVEYMQDDKVVRYSVIKSDYKALERLARRWVRKAGPVIAEGGGWRTHDDARSALIVPAQIVKY